MAYATTAELSARITADEGTPPETAVLSALLEKAKADIDAYCKRDFDKHQDAVVAFPATGSDKYLLPYYPVLKISQISVDGDELSADALSAVVWYPWGIIVMPYPVLKGAEIAVKLDYGYETTPAPVKEATLRLASRYARIPCVKERNAVGMRSESLGEYSAGFEKQEIDNDVALLLSKLRVRK